MRASCKDEERYGYYGETNSEKEKNAPESGRQNGQHRLLYILFHMCDPVSVSVLLHIYQYDKRERSECKRRRHVLAAGDSSEKL